MNFVAWNKRDNTCMSRDQQRPGDSIYIFFFLWNIFIDVLAHVIDAMLMIEFYS